MKGLISFSLFIIIAIIIWWSITVDFSGGHHLQQTNNKPYVDIFMHEFELTAMDENGAPSYILHGSYLEQFHGSDDAEIKQPVFHLLKKNAQWKITADNAIVNNKNQTIQLNNNVLMQQQNVEPAVSIRTQTLLLHTKTQIAQTQALINFTKGLSQIKSNGMIFNNITSELELLSHVSGYYLPNE
ncbi:MAG: LPS export ABC transporter periplasmic protein LptC [Gammaproteobacteria bacterium]